MNSRTFLLVSAVLVTACSKRAPITLEGSAKTIEQDGKVLVQVDLITQPGVWLYSERDTIGERGKPADAQGHGTFLIDPRLPGGGTIDLKFGASHKGEGSSVWWLRPSYTVAMPVRLWVPEAGAARLACSGGAHCDISYNAQQQLVDIRDIPEGATLVVDGKPVTLKQKERTTVVLDAVTLVQRFGQVDACNDKGSAATVPVKIPVQLSTADGVVSTADLDLKKEMCQLASDALFQVTRGPLVPSAGPGTVTAVGNSHFARTLGPARTLGDVRLVVLTEDVDRRASCGTYENETTKERQEITRLMVDLRAKAYERATGKVVAEKTFAAPPGRCPQRMNEGGSLVTRADAAAVDTWAAKL